MFIHFCCFNPLALASELNCYDIKDAFSALKRDLLFFCCFLFLLIGVVLPLKLRSHLRLINRSNRRQSYVS